MGAMPVANFPHQLFPGFTQSLSELFAAIE